ncbi:MAG: hypothetical protein AMS15_07740 [Planctomycetes bacterium DG_23]|nr:MAG: hypothetical protein AMS15_07740 [Planctomycetes bacterium DG_23]
MKRSSKAGTTLIEVLIYIAIMGVLTQSVLSIFYRAHKTNHFLSQHLFDLQGASQMMECFKEDVRRAKGLLGVYQTSGETAYQTGEDVLILDPCDFGCIIYALEDGQVVRRRYEGEMEQKWAFRPPIARLHFSFDAPTPQEARLVTVNVELQRRSKTKGQGRVFSMQVALRSKEAK